MRYPVLGVLLVAGIACGNAQSTAPPAGAGQSAPAGQSSGAVVAEVGGRQITLQQLDDRWLALDPAEQARVTQLMYQNRRTVLDQMVGDLLIEDAAKAAGLTPEQYVQQESAKRVQPVTDAEIAAFYEQNKDRAQGRTLADLREPIRDFLNGQRQQQARAMLVDELKTKSGTPVRVLLDPPRRNVEIAAHDPSAGPENAPITIVEFSDYQ
ncbi:MAG: hypothetical protein AB1635_12550 [Acidobacteriota bacterium]